MAPALPGVTRTSVGRTDAGQPIDLITFGNRAGIEVRALTYGGVIMSIRTPDRHGRIGDIALGFDTAERYLGAPAYLGALVGRYANRIAGATFTLDGRRYQLAANNGANHLHGGRQGWSHAVWRAATFEDARGAGVMLMHTSPDGDEGYPGTVRASVTYTLNNDGALVIEYEATTDAPTIINLTQHAYFNLSAGGSEHVLGHEVRINADRFTPTREDLIPTGEIAPVAGTALDFRTARAIGERIASPEPAIARAGGYDHNFVLNTQAERGLIEAAFVVDPTTGRTLRLSTTQPGLQLYTANFFDGSIVGKSGAIYRKHAGFCLETQHFPDSPHHADFPSVILRPGEVYRELAKFEFGIRN
jgi:aldose 1-epimerase